MSPSQAQLALARVNCEVAFDNPTRQLYATDASIYQIEPLAVGFPRTAPEAAALFQAAGQAGLPVTPRGAGTGLVGGALGDGLIVDFARHNGQIRQLDLEQRTVRVGAGVVLDQLNQFLKPHGFCFGPDVATSSRATLGGMIANNSSGARVPIYGTTLDHVRALEIVLMDGRVVQVGPDHDTLPAQRELAAKRIGAHAAELVQRLPSGLMKRNPGYALDRFHEQPGNLVSLLAGSEGTLAGIFSAQMRITPLPRQKGLALAFFASVADAMQATVELLDLQPAAIEHIDHVLLDQTRGQRQFKAARDLLELDAKPCESILMVEFFDEVPDRLALFRKRRLGLRQLVLDAPNEMNLVWGLRKAGLSLLTSRKGPAKPVTGIEDTAVRPAQLPAYVAALESIMKPLGLEVCYYGHAAAGLLHVRPVLDLHQAGDRQKLRRVADEVSALVRQFGGSLAAEHGVGIARTEYLQGQIGPQLISVMRSIKESFDPLFLLNPGKIIDDGRYKIDRHLRIDPQRPLQLPFEPRLAFVAKDGSFVANLEQCNGCGGCRKQAPTMCPTFIATGEEIMSTRGRANLIRAVLEGRLSAGQEPLCAAELELALEHCLGCKACTSECPSNVNMALLKAELLHARHQRTGRPWRARLFGAVDQLGRLGCLAPSLANRLLEQNWIRRLFARGFGISRERRLPRYAVERFDHWFAHHTASGTRRRGQVILWDDTFVRYHEPHIAIAAVEVLEAAGFSVELVQGRQCCGRPAFSQGDLDKAARLGRHNLDLLQNLRAGAANRTSSSDPTSVGLEVPASRPRSITSDPAYAERGALPILFLEPSCYSMFIEEYRELKLAGAEQIAGHCFLFEEFLESLLEREPNALRFRTASRNVAVHSHCHAKALGDPSHLKRLAQHLPATQVTLLETGCCGMAGAFGMLETHLKLSRQVAAPLVEQIQRQPSDSILVASGTSCRQQIFHLTAARPLHWAELLAQSLA
jgi:FAD/FMN-containing dehydrogenase/Fe-S oxidoreductase